MKRGLFNIVDAGIKTLFGTADSKNLHSIDER
jgi:hypothetical protein